MIVGAAVVVTVDISITLKLKGCEVKIGGTNPCSLRGTTIDAVASSTSTQIVVIVVGSLPDVSHRREIVLRVHLSRYAGYAEPESVVFIGTPGRPVVAVGSVKERII